MGTMKITCIPDGPYVLAGGEVVLRREDGTRIAEGGGVALCRCGGSGSKPFCDGTHAKIGFSGRRQSDGGNDRRDAYAGRTITIFDNRAVCAHAGVCTDRLARVFRMHAEPWIDADAAPAEEIAATIAKCPSGALGFALEGVEAAPPVRPPAVSVTRDGPYAITGGIELDAPFGKGASREHYTLCRCGGSKNKPFCDGTHWHLGFKAP